MTTTPPTKPDKQRLAGNAARLLSDPAFKAAMEAVKGTYVQSMINTAPDEHHQREHLHRCIHALSDIETALTAFVQTGTVEKSMAIKQQKAKK